MIELKLSEGIADVSEHRPIIRREDPIQNIVSVIDHVFRMYHDYSVRQGYNPKSSRLLLAHGADKAGRFVYFDEIKDSVVYYPVEEWIKSNEANHDVLFVMVCNPGSKKIPQGQSLVIYPNHRISGSLYGVLLDDVLSGFLLPEELGIFLISHPIKA